MQNIELEENDSSVEEVKKVLSLPEKDMYERQLSFLQEFKEKMFTIKTDTYNLLASLTNSSDKKQKKLPYTIYRSFEGVVKKIRKLKQKNQQENKKYKFIISSREELKVQQNQLFRIYMKTLNEKKEELKKKINTLQRKVQQLQEQGLSPYVDFYVKLPLNMDLRSTYNSKVLLSRIQTRNQLSIKILECFKENKAINVDSLDDNLITKFQYTFAKQLFNYRNFREKLILIRMSKVKKQKTGQKLKLAIKKQSEEKQKIKKERLIIQHARQMTQTDYFIYLKEIHKDIQNMMGNFIFEQYRVSKRKHRSKSCHK